MSSSSITATEGKTRASFLRKKQELTTIVNTDQTEHSARSFRADLPLV